MASLVGTIIEYSYAGADSYRLAFGEGSATWTALSGDHAGDHRTEDCDAAQVAEGVWFVSWLEPTLEVVSLCINLSDHRIYASYYYNGERFFWRGNVTQIAHPTTQQ